MRRRGVARWFALFSVEASNFVLLLVLILAARVVGPDEYGRFAFLFTLTNLLAELFDFGLSAFVLREFARRGAEARALVWSAVRIQLLAVLIAVVLAEILTVWFAPGLALLVPAAFLAVSAVLRTVKSYVRHAWRGMKQFGVEALSLWFERAILLAGTIGILAHGGKTLALAAIFVTTRLVDVFVSFAITKRIIGPSLSTDSDKDLSGLRLVIKSAPLALTVIFTTLYYQVDVLMLGVLSVAAQVGIYHAVYRFVDIALAVARVLTTVFTPALSIYHVESGRDFRECSGRILALVSSVGLLLIFAGPFVSEIGVSVLLGAAYAEGARILDYLLIAAGISMVSLCLTTILVAANRERGVAIMIAVAAAANVAANMALIPQFGALGATWATVMSEALLVAGLIGISVRMSIGFSWLRSTGAIALAGVGSAYLALAFPEWLVVVGALYVSFILAAQYLNIRALLDILGQ
jgi:O-antigen/teichoic acid export membrane protein